MARSEIARWFLGEDRPEHLAELEVEAGWYRVNGTLRYYDGEKWTEHIAPPYPASISGPSIALSVMVGVFLALFLVWLGSQVSPEHIYLPVKFVVKELPRAFR